MSEKMLQFSSIAVNVKESILKIIVIIVVITALFLGIGGAAYSRQDFSVPEEPEKASVPVNDENVYVLTEEEFNWFSEEIVREMYQTKEYFTTSLLMRLNPYALNTEKLYMQLELEETDSETKSIMLNTLHDAYQIWLSSEECYEYVCEQTGFSLEKKYLEELIFYNKDISNISLAGKSGGNSGGSTIGSAIIEIQVIGENEEFSRRIADALEEYLLAKSETVQSTVYPHQLNTMMQESTVLSNETLESLQRSRRQACLYYMGSGVAESAQNSFRLITDFSTKTTVKASVRPLPYFLGQYGIMGCLAGIIGAVLYILAKCLKDKRVYDYKEYCGRRNISHLDIAQYGLKDKSATSEESPVFLYDIKTMLMPEAGKEVMIICPLELGIPEGWKTVAQELDITLNLADRFMGDKEQLEKLRAAENILIVCRHEETTYREIDFIMNRIDTSRVTVCGMIVI